MPQAKPVLTIVLAVSFLLASAFISLPTTSFVTFRDLGSYADEVTCDATECRITFPEEVEIGKAANTGSMLPTFGDDTLIVAKPTDLKVNDIVLYENDGYLLVHRIVRVEDGLYCLKGDNNPVEDGCFPADSIKWKVVGIIY